eukprot:CAMPEP_0172312736 /NCGR_PEP_ID=MMETSP1058-20130122/18532_1 /TAXON_ID=83371 /ORGANISM="Detonula confervacea, Strain CCMP 353" /LENGTH=373 /DNA_ID=CAMNT_0013026279 /DNA_START=110 /DNA_END=1231 /DNA_ORIENTATION=-
MSMSSSRASQHQRHLPPSLNSPIIIGYAHDAKSGKTEQAIRDGANVIIWSFLHLEIDDDGAVGGGKIRTELNLEEIRTIRDRYEHVMHLAAFGGWNGPHPPATMTGKQWFDVFLHFNTANGHVFDGVDWDYEGHDDLQSPTAQLTIDTLDIMADFSVEAKKHGMIVSMAPAESYLDASIKPGSVDEKFSLALDLPPRAWASDRYYASEDDRALVESKGFRHAGRQCYVYVLAKAGVDTFDWISIQLYESYSPFAHDVHQRKLEQVDALMIRIHQLIKGYTVTDLPLESSEYEVKLPASKLVLGIANKWADGLKVCKVEPSAVRSAYESTLTEHGRGFLGVMFWTIEEEGIADGERLTHLLSREFKKLGLSSEL